MSTTSKLKNGVKRTLNVLGMGATVRDIWAQTKYKFDLKTQSRNARFEEAFAPDGLPMPPPKLIYLVTGQFDQMAFYQNGVVGANCIHNILEKRALKLSEFSKILDFGCGCGRVMRQWQKLIGPRLYGVDYNPALLDWCRQNLPFATFNVNRMSVPLDFPDDTFDFIYAISVFTHLTEPGQWFWMNELFRVLQPGGYLLFTVHGVSRIDELSPQGRQVFEAGSPVIVGSQYSGTNFCGTYHPRQYIENVLCKEWRLMSFEPGGARDANQDMFLMQKPLRSDG